MARQASGTTVRSRRLGRELRRLRESANVSVERASELLRCSVQTIYRQENGAVSVRLKDANDLLALYRVTDTATREAVLELAKTTTQQGWWRPYGDVVPRWLQVYIGLEGDTTEIKDYHSAVVPGLLQTRDYANAVIRTDWLAGEEEVAKRVDLRTDRQARVLATNPPKVDVVLDEAVLRRPVGGRHVHRSQLGHLLEVGSRDDVTIQVTPYSIGAHAPLGTPFTYLGFTDEDDPDVVYIEIPTGSLYIEKPQEVRHYREIFDRLQTKALSAEASADKIASLMKEL